ncbi:Pentatricopeptide repeat-containing protein [Acorus calamus]|uniref:Pentatricopeptide repeat-containing protein n=1 Tax=Acorus calamus TaxID=4465 RepID=A0AAV9F7G5_ACOCL|nr:Pentatricopeptide repeat-containing protein [Acorus calamus]
MDRALSLFETLTSPDTFQYNVMIRGYTNAGRFEEAIEFYHLMRSAGVRGDSFTFPFVIKSCGGALYETEGETIHCTVIKTGLDSDVFIANSLITMYAKMGKIESAEGVFRGMPERDLVSWNSMIGGYVSDEDWRRALDCFQEMQALGIRPDRFSIIAAFSACSLEKLWKQGKEIHAHIVRCGFDTDPMIQTSVIDMYAKCGEVRFAELSFRMMPDKNIVHWNTLISGYALNGQPLETLDRLIEMQSHGFRPDLITMVNLLPAYTQSSRLLQGKSVHGIGIRRGFVPHLVLETALLNMYGKCGEPRSAERLFDRMVEKYLVSYNGMISTYVQNGLSMEAILLFHSLREGPLNPDVISISSILPVYAESGSLRQGKQMHGYVVKCGHISNEFISNSMIYVYAKCGDITAARSIFDGMVSKGVVSWNVIIMGYAIHGCGEIALQLFSEMIENGIQPNRSTIFSVLSACSIAGLVEEGMMYFDSMTRDYNIEPQIEHYGCMVDLIGRSGDLAEAKTFISRMPMVPTSRIWGSLLNASRHYGDIETAEFAVEHILQLEHDNTGCHVLISNMYVEAGRMEDAERVRSLMRREGLQRTTAQSSVELHCETHQFVNGDRSHAQTSTVYAVLGILSNAIGEGETAGSDNSFRPAEALANRVRSPRHHGVRLALCYGLISTTVGLPILIRKNVRICGDCHRAMKMMSEVIGREVVIGDSKIYHHFRGGVCCCGDYW